MTSQSLQSWLIINCNGRKSTACRQLGISRPTLDKYLSGKKLVPKYIALACAAIELYVQVASKTTQKESVE